jgi:hypothetical protein
MAGRHESTSGLVRFRGFLVVHFFPTGPIFVNRTLDDVADEPKEAGSRKTGKDGSKEALDK